MSDEQVPLKEGEFLPQPNYGLPQPSLDTAKYYTKLDGFKYSDGEDEESIIEGEIPPYMKTYFWVFLNKDIVLTYIRDKRDLERIMNMFEGCVESFEMSLKPGKYDWKTLRDIDNLRTIVFIRTLRAIQGFERKQESTSIQEFTHRNENAYQNQNPQQPRSGLRGFADRFFGGR